MVNKSDLTSLQVEIKQLRIEIESLKSIVKTLQESKGSDKK